MNSNRTQYKLNQLYKDIKFNETLLNKDDTENIILNFFKRTNKANIIISDTDWQPVSPLDSSYYFTTEKNTLMPEFFPIYNCQDFDIPDFFLPYIDCMIHLKVNEGSFVSSFQPYVRTSWTGNFVRIKGDGSILLEYPSGTFYSYTAIPDDNLVEYQVDLNRTKNAWNGTLYLTGSPSSYSGKVGRITVWNGYTSFTISITSGISYENFINITSDYFSGIGTYVTYDEDWNPITSVQATQTHSFSSVDNYSITLLYVDSADNVYDFTRTKSSITARQFTYQGKYVFWNTSKNRPISYKLQTGDDVQVFTTFIPIDYFSSINLSRNPNDYPTTKTTSNMFSDSFIGASANKSLIPLLISEGTETVLPKYRFALKTTAVVLSPATVPFIHTFKTQEDTYTHPVTSWVRTTNTVGSKEKSSYYTQLNDIQYKLQYIIKNPLYYKEIRRYDTNQ